MAVSKPPRDLGQPSPLPVRPAGRRGSRGGRGDRQTSCGEAGDFAPGGACQWAGRPGFLHMTSPESPSRPPGTGDRTGSHPAPRDWSWGRRHRIHVLPSVNASPKPGGSHGVGEGLSHSANSPQRDMGTGRVGRAAISSDLPSVLSFHGYIVRRPGST